MPLNDALLSIALADDEPVVLRNTAALRSLELAPPTLDANPLAALAHLRGEPPDEDDELLGAGLRALLRAGSSLASLLAFLRPPRNPDLIGNYNSRTPSLVPL